MSRKNPIDSNILQAQSIITPSRLRFDFKVEEVRINTQFPKTLCHKVIRNN